MMNPTARDELIKVLSEPRTYREVADITGLHYMTARNYVLELVAEGDAVQLPFKQGNRLQFMRQTGVKDDTGVRVVLGDKLVTLPELIERSREVLPPEFAIGALLSQVWAKSACRGAEDVAVNVKQGPWHVIQYKPLVRQYAAAMRKLAKACEQLLDVEELWDDEKAAACFGEGIDPDRLLDLAEPMLHWAHEQAKG